MRSMQIGTLYGHIQNFTCVNKFVCEICGEGFIIEFNMEAWKFILRSRNRYSSLCLICENDIRAKPDMKKQVISRTAARQEWGEAAFDIAFQKLYVNPLRISKYWLRGVRTSIQSNWWFLSAPDNMLLRFVANLIWFDNENIANRIETHEEVSLIYLGKGIVIFIRNYGNTKNVVNKSMENRFYWSEYLGIVVTNSYWRW